MANPDEIYPVDLATAGAGQQPTPPGGLVDAMRSQGTPPSGLMEALRPPQMTGLTMAAAAATGGLNPTGVNPLVRQQNIQQEMQMQQAQLIQRAQEHQQSLQIQKIASAHGVLKDMLFGPNAIQDKGAREGLAKQNAGMIQQITGQQVPVSVVQQWSAGGPNQKSQKRLAELVSVADIATDPEEKMRALQGAQQYFMENGGTPQDWVPTLKLMSNPSFLKANGLPSKEQNVLAAAKTEEELDKAFIAKNPDFANVKGQERAPGLAAEFARNVLKKSMRDVTDPAEMAAMSAYVKYGLAKDKKTEADAKLDEKRAESDITLARQKELAQFTAGLKTEQGPKWNETQAKASLKNIDVADTAMTESRAMRASLDRLAAKKLLPTDATPTSGLWADAKQAWNYNDPDVRFLKNTILPYFIGLVDRGLNDEKGTRAMAMFTKQIELVTKAPTKASLEKLFDLSEYMFYNKAAKSLALHERAAGRIDPAVLDEERSRFQELFPKPITDPSLSMGGPLSPGSQAPPGFKKVQ